MSQELPKGLPKQTVQQIEQTSELAKQFGQTGEVEVKTNEYGIQEVNVDLGSSTVIWHIHESHLERNHEQK